MARIPPICGGWSTSRQRKDWPWSPPTRPGEDGRTFRARSGTLAIPADLVDLIEGVFGFDQRPQARTRFRVRQVDKTAMLPMAAAPNSFSPPQIAQLYRFPPGATGQRQTIAIIELGGGYRQTDLDTFFTNLGIAPPLVTAVSVDGAVNQPGGDPTSADGEVLLDIEVAGSVAPAAALAVYFAPNTTQGFLDAITTAVHDQNTNPNVISISWGAAESAWTSQALQSYDQTFQDAVALGVMVCTASGGLECRLGQRRQRRRCERSFSIAGVPAIRQCSRLGEFRFRGARGSGCGR